MNKSAGFIDLDFMFTDSYFLKAIIYVTGSVYASSLFSCYKHPRIVFVHFITNNEPKQAFRGKGMSFKTDKIMAVYSVSTDEPLCICS